MALPELDRRGTRIAAGGDSDAGTSARMTVRTCLQRQPGAHQDMPDFVREPERRLPVYGDYEVVVLGGGPAGIAAAAAAAGAGRRTLLIERYGFLGGMGTAAGDRKSVVEGKSG